MINLKKIIKNLKNKIVIQTYGSNCIIDDEQHEHITFLFFIIMFVLIVAFFISVFTDIKIERTDIFIGDNNNKVKYIWKCNDGCYNMLLVIYENVTYTDLKLRNYHMLCTDICFKSNF